MRHAKSYITLETKYGEELHIAGLQTWLGSSINLTHMRRICTVCLIDCLHHCRNISESMKGLWKSNTTRRSQVSASMKNKPKVCSYCGTVGHNRLGCPQLHPEKQHTEKVRLAVVKLEVGPQDSMCNVYSACQTFQRSVCDASCDFTACVHAAMMLGKQNQAYTAKQRLQQFAGTLS